MNRELPDDVHQSIKRLCAKGDSLAEAADYSDAIVRYEQALALLPTPHQDWEAATWIYAALGDTYFLAGDFQRARQALTAVMLCPNALDNPFLWLRRGQVYFELEDMKQAQDIGQCIHVGWSGDIRDRGPKVLDFHFFKDGADEMTASHARREPGHRALVAIRAPPGRRR